MSTFSQMSDDPRSWTVVTDQVMGGKSELEANYDEGTFQLKGYVTTENNGGFVRLAHRPDSIDKNTKGIKFMAKGNDETYGDTCN
jgi:Complex I intermediate-associated protein 30 (CIA30).